MLVNQKFMLFYIDGETRWVKYKRCPSSQIIGNEDIIDEEEEHVIPNSHGTPLTHFTIVDERYFYHMEKNDPRGIVLIYDLEEECLVHNGCIFENVGQRLGAAPRMRAVNGDVYVYEQSQVGYLFGTNVTRATAPENPIAFDPGFGMYSNSLFSCS